MLAGILVIRSLSKTDGVVGRPAAASVSRNTGAKRSRKEEIEIVAAFLDAAESAAATAGRTDKLTPSDQRKLEKMCEDAYQRIAAAHRMTVADLKDFVEAQIPHVKPPTFYQRNHSTISVLLLDGLLILNMPVYRLLALVLFGGWQSFLSALGEELTVRPGEGTLHPRVILFFFLCGLAVVGELGLLLTYLS
jgi:hypothetical protein